MIKFFNYFVSFFLSLMLVIQCSPITLPLSSPSKTGIGIKLSEINRETILVLPKKLLNKKTFDNLNLTTYAEKYCQNVELVNLLKFSSIPDKDRLLIPKNTETLFIFNKTSHFNVLGQKNGLEYTNLVEKSIPFNLPKTNVKLLDYYLVLPLLIDNMYTKIKQNGDKGSAVLNECYTLQQLSITQDIYLPLIFSKSPEYTNVPLLIFSFKLGTDSNYGVEKQINKPYFKVDHNIEKYFNSLCDEWINNGPGYNKLVTSRFCVTNTNNKNDSYCLELSNPNENFEALDEKKKVIIYSNFGITPKDFTKKTTFLLVNKTGVFFNEMLGSSSNDVNHIYEEPRKCFYSQFDKLISKRSPGLKNDSSAGGKNISSIDIENTTTTTTTKKKKRENFSNILRK
ncbi:uncharacterized protein SCDLUD_001275 [Saccharomycodes ludwigii]|uniref:uncharacterized protein n=1 Tax=Saccharomycodes ludwigii TaxID=36035 RepID=UPI001E8AB21A|nr:hypothetical protein SCDLUD_001275 [Saccharomycodes ludwigii]KAH3903630.1 hypothetical protein SCDLUD_001275 [Saccharomycodes ludwigii]